MSTKHTLGGASLPFYPLSIEGDPMYCLCDHSGVANDDLCVKCPHRAEHQAAASAELESRLAAILKATEGTP